MNNNTSKVESVNTKLSSELFEAFSSACEAVGLTGYDVLQRMALSFLRSSSRSVALSPAMRNIIQDYGRYEDDSVKLIMGQEAEIVRAIYIVKGKKERPAAVMTKNDITEADARVDVNIHHILELVTKVCFPDIHRHLKELQERFGTPNMAATIRQLIDQSSDDMISADIADLFSDNERTESGEQIYGRELCVQKKRRDMEQVARKTTVQLDLFEDQVLGAIFSRDNDNEEGKEDEA